MKIAFWITLGILAYVHVGYWALMRVIVWLRKPLACPELQELQYLPTVSLIIPAHNEEGCLARKLQNALEVIQYPRELLEVIVASDGSEDDTVNIARTFERAGVRLLAFDKRRGKSAVLNDAVAAASGDVLCLCDANVMFQPEALRILVDRLAAPGVGAVTGDVRLESADSDFGEGECVYYRIERCVQVGESRIGSTIGVDGGMYVIRRELFRPLPADTILDDFVTSMNVIRAGYRLLYEPTAIATENGTPHARQEFRRRVRLSAGAAQCLKRGDFPMPWQPITFAMFLSHKLLRWTGPVWLVAALVFNGLLWNDGFVYQLLLAGQLVCYSAAVAATFSHRLRATRLGGTAFYFVMSYIALAAGFFMGLFNLQSAAWARTDRTPVSNHAHTAVHSG